MKIQKETVTLLDIWCSHSFSFGLTITSAPINIGITGVLILNVAGILDCHIYHCSPVLLFVHQQNVQLVRHHLFVSLYLEVQ